MCTTWYYGDTNEIVEFGMIFNTAYGWGIDKDGEGTKYQLLNAFDVQNIATHELGHGIGLAVHEDPVVNFENKGLIQEGMVFTMIPGKNACLACFQDPVNDRESCSAEKDPSIVGTSMLVSALMLVEFQNLYMSNRTIPPH
jgi:Xaa-Pro aminopeptidase